ncbi:MAG: hypothetical protein O3B73_14195 [bacterium]|nr:hypothetical protein [bacterium]
MAAREATWRYGASDPGDLIDVISEHLSPQTRERTARGGYTARKSIVDRDVVAFTL